MNTFSLGRSDLQSTRLIYGCMRLPGVWDPAQVDDKRRRDAYAALDAAVAAGYNHFDHADIYGNGSCEEIFGAWLANHADLRERLVITTKCGIRRPGDPLPDSPHRYDFSGEWITTSCENSMTRLGVETIDLFLLHRPDVLMDPAEIAGVFDQLRSQGKVRWFGVSNFTSAQFDLLQTSLSQPLACNQIAIHPLQLAPIEDGTLDHLHRLDVTPTAWSPLAGGAVGDDAEGRDDHHRAILEAIDAEADDLGVSRTVAALAWLMRHPSGVMPIVGSRNPKRITDAAAADKVNMSRDAWYRIYLSARGQALP